MKQVVSHTIKAAVRGNLQVVDGRFAWGLGLFHTLNNDDIINWKTAAYANHTYVDATFRSAPTLNSLYNPLNATPGINFTNVPRADPEGRRRALADAGAGGAVVVAASNLVLFGDEGQSERPAAGLCHARRPYLVRCHQARAAHAIVNNVLDRHFAAHVPVGWPKGALLIACRHGRRRLVCAAGGGSLRRSRAGRLGGRPHIDEPATG